MSKLDSYFTSFYNAEHTKKLLEMQNDRDLYDSLVDADHIFDQASRIDKFLEILSLNKHLIKGKTILNIRPKLAIVAVAAIREGAKHVTIVDDSNLTNYLKTVIEKNNLSEKVTIVKKSIKDEDLQLEKFDILLSDWIGSFGVNQGYVDEFVAARDRFVKPDGIVS